MSESSILGSLIILNILIINNKYYLLLNALYIHDT